MCPCRNFTICRLADDDMRKFRSLRAAEIALAFCFAGAASFIALKMYFYLTTDAPPFGYYYDLGVNIITTSYIAHAIHSWDDFVDNVGWGSWGNFQNFLFNPTTSYFILVPLEMLLKNVWLTVKVVQIVEELVAFGGAAYLYATAVRRNGWGLVAGLLYAILPATALEIRGNVDIGWVVALLPVAIAVSLNLARRFGPAALPLCGIVSSAAGLCFAPEYGVLSSIPIYAFSVAAALPRLTLRGVACTILGFLCLIGLGSFFIFPTVGGAHLFSDPNSRANSLASGAELRLFSESWFALGVLLPREFLLSTFRQFNARPDLEFVWLATGTMWCLAFASAWRLVREPTPLRRVILAGNVVLIALALGAYLPFGNIAWAMLHAVPSLGSLRTADRFLIVPLLFVVLGAGDSLDRLSKATRPAWRAVPVVLVSLSIALFLKLDFAQHWLTNEANLSYREPDLATVNRAVARAGGRTLSYAYVRDGSQYFTPDYGVPNPTLWFFWDQSLHYSRDGLGGSGIFGRADVRTVVASPNWMLEGQLLPAASRIDAAFPGTLVFARRDGLTVKRIASRPALVVAKTSCVVGGPGLLDWATSISELQGVSFVRSPVRCRGRTYFDYDPRDALADGAPVLGFWTAQELLPSATSLLDADYPLAVGRTFVNDGWYRNSVDGDDVASPTGAKRLSGPTSIPIRLGSLRAGSSEPDSLLVRLASHGFSELGFRASNGASSTIHLSPKRGMHWYRLRIGAAARAPAITLTFGRSRPERRPPTDDWNGVALDRVVALQGGLPASEPTAPTDAVLFTLTRFFPERAARDADDGKPRPHLRLAAIAARIWLPRGAYTVRVYRPGQEERYAAASLDGGHGSHCVRVRRTGFHDIALENIYTDDRVLAFIADVTRSAVPDAVQASTYRWAVRVKKRATLEVAWYPDGNWHLERDSEARPIAPPVRCDLINTCFVDIAPGRYRLYHSWPASFTFGLLLSALALIVACALLLPELRSARSTRRRFAERSG